MIRYSLQCEIGHEFESWFLARMLTTNRSSASSLLVRRAARPRSRKPSWHRGSPAPINRARCCRPRCPCPRPCRRPRSPTQGARRHDLAPGAGIPAKLKALRDHLVQNAEHVGPRFPKKRARCITVRSSIVRSTAKRRPEEAKELHDEGIEFHPLPVLPEDRN